MAPPVIRLGTSDRLNINFDIIGEDAEFLRYRLLHCNSDWLPSRLLESEYLDGFNEVSIDDYAFSSNTYIHYVNYNISLPNHELPILVPGNYLLQVFPEGDPMDLLLQVRFSVSENKVPVTGSFTTKTDKGINSEFQQLALEADISAFPSVNPYQDLILTITQNNRPETSVTINNPIRVLGNKVIFEHDPRLIFEAGNEYRRFETVRVDYPGMNVDSVKFIDDMWHAWIKPDISRREKEYTYDKTQHGRFKIDEYNSTNPDLSADYVMVHFSLEPDRNNGEMIFLQGDMTNNSLEEEFLMRYDWNDGLYHLDLPLKQGSYNYQYITVTNNSNKPSITPGFIEGNKFETQNEYLVKVFLRTPGAHADRLIGSCLIH